MSKSDPLAELRLARSPARQRYSSRLLVARTFACSAALELPTEIGIGRGDGGDRRAMQVRRRSRHRFRHRDRWHGSGGSTCRSTAGRYRAARARRSRAAGFLSLFNTCKATSSLDFVAQNAQRLGALLALEERRLRRARHSPTARLRQRLMLSSIDSTICSSTNGTPSALSRTLSTMDGSGAPGPQLMGELAHLGRGRIESQDHGGDVAALQATPVVPSAAAYKGRTPRSPHQAQAVDAFEVEEMQILDHDQRRSARRQLRQGLDQGTGDLGLGQQPDLLCSALALASSTVPSGPSSRWSIPPPGRMTSSSVAASPARRPPG